METTVEVIHSIIEMGVFKGKNPLRMKFCAFVLLAMLVVLSYTSPLQPDPKIIELLEFAETAPDQASIVTIEQQILAILVAAGLAWKASKCTIATSECINATDTAMGRPGVVEFENKYA